ncbi:MAG: FtsX-like permease family protein [Lentisphaeria bacterium]|nr:FtsX-like permease family protein [Lentisphaeria bacterium]
MNPRSDIDVRPQVQLSLKKSLRFCLKGIAYRLFRSSLTLSVVVVAVAFFMVLLSESVIVQSVGRGVHGQVLEMREADMLLSHLFHPHSTGALSAKLAEAYDHAGQLQAVSGGPGGKKLERPTSNVQSAFALRGYGETGSSTSKLQEVSRVTGLDADAVESLARACELEQRYLRFFAGLALGKRVILVEKNKGRDVFAYLRDARTWEQFLADLAKMRSTRLPTDTGTLRRFLDSYPATLDALQDLRKRWLKSTAAMQAELDAVTGGKDLAAWMAASSDEKVEHWRQTVTAHGFSLDAGTMGRVRESLTVTAWETEISRLLQTPENRAEWKRIFLTTPVLEDKLMMLTDDRAGKILGDAFDAARRAAVSQRYARRKHLRELVAALPLRKPGVPEPRFLDGKQMFLVTISFLVCMVGIANAMLMAITERFREIATMKCLGATDSFILKQFLIEAAIQGIVGGSLGMLIGLLITMIKGVATLGGTVFTFFPGLPVVWCGLFTVAVGVLLAMFASIYPSWAAARMAPMEAMRVE